MGPVARSLSSQGFAFRLHADWRAALDAARPHLAVVNPPFHRITEVTLECLARGIHVLAEKPLATEWEGLDALRAAGADRSIGSSAPRLMAMLSMRYEPAYHAGYLWAKAGGLGKPVLLSAQKS
jgi:predicted dehydrogenase